MATLQTWVIAMSSSNIRSFRHTATVVALEVETALCDVAAAVEKEAEIVGRQREGERKRKASGKGSGKEKEFDKKAAEVRERRTKLAEFIKEFVDGFVYLICAARLQFSPLTIAFSFTDIVTLTQTSVPNVSAQWALGSRNILLISSTGLTYVMLAGFSQMPVPKFVWRPSNPCQTCITKETF